MYQIPNIFDRLFYYCFSDEESCPIVLILDLTFTVDPAILKRALNQALRRNGAFRPIPFITPEGEVAYADNPLEAEVYPYEEASRCFGTEDMNGYMFRVMYEGKRIVLSIYHALADGRGVLGFARTLLFYYLFYAGTPVQAERDILTLYVPQDPTERADPEKLYAQIEARARTASPLSLAMRDIPMFQFPETPIPLESPVHTRRFQYVLDTKAFLGLAHRSGASFLSLLSALVASTIRELYDPGSDVITMIGVVDLRPHYGNRTLSNFAEVFTVPFFEPLLQLDPLSQAQVVKRAVIDPQLTRENLDRLLRVGMETRRALYTVPVTDDGALRRIRAGSWADRRVQGTFSITNVGAASMGTLSPYISGMDMFIPAVSKQPFFAVLSHGGKSVLNLLQRFESDQLAKALLRTFQRQGLTVQLLDRGDFEGDKLFLSRLRRTD